MQMCRWTAGGDSVTVRWTPDSPRKLDPSRAQLGDCSLELHRGPATRCSSPSLCGTAAFTRQVTETAVTSHLDHVIKVEWGRLLHYVFNQ